MDSYKDENGNLIEKVHYHIIGYLPVENNVYCTKNNNAYVPIKMRDNICINFEGILKYEEDNGIVFSTSIYDALTLYPCDDTNMDNINLYKVESIGESYISDTSSIVVTRAIKVIYEVNKADIKMLTNKGKSSTGYCNHGDNNSGSFNFGNNNSGNINAGNYNVGNSNIGDFNTGDNNMGNYNGGAFNKGSFNIGSFNLSNYNVGFFNSKEDAKITMFNKPSNWTLRDWIESRASDILMSCPIVDTEYDDNGSNFLTTIETDHIVRQDWWNNLPEEDKQEILKLPNFDAGIFYKCTGIRIIKKK